jgi:hypothetical protein
MNQRLAEWKYELDRIWSAHAPDYREAMQLTQQIASLAEDEVLRQAASQAQPILRCAAEAGADHATCVAARRRLNVIREVLSALTTRQFGRRAALPKALSAEDRSRELLGLPLGRRLSESEIHRAYKLLAKRTHPDAGGSEEAFLRISAAHEALIRERRLSPRH